MKTIYKIFVLIGLIVVNVFPQKLNQTLSKNSTPNQTQSVEWSALSSGVNGNVYAVAVMGNYIYVGGSFSTAGGNTANNIARWNTSTSSWSALSYNGHNGVNGTVYALAVDADYYFVYAGGSFTSAGGVSVSNIAGWQDDDGEDIHQWNALGLGVNNTVYALALDYTLEYDYLYVGGAFTSAGSTSVNHIACYDAGNTGNWLNYFSPGVDGDVRSIVVSGSNVYIGGDFINAGGNTSNCIASYNTSTQVWTSLSSGMSGTNKAVYTITLSGSNIYAGGVFDHAGGVAANNIAEWNGSNWSALGTGISYSSGSVSINAIVIKDYFIYAGGSFNNAGGISADNIAKYDGASWSALGSGVNDKVNSAKISGNYIYAGGTFTTAGGNSANRIARILDTDFFLPIVTTSSITDVGTSTATGGGNVTSDHGYSVTARGVCWSTSQYPTVSDSHTSDGTGIGSFSSSLTGLTDGTTYHTRAYATNFYGTSYGSDISFNTFSNSPGTALKFGGIDDYVNIPDNNELDLTINYTIEAWIKPEAFSSMGGIVSKYQTAGTHGYYIRLTSTGDYNGLTFDAMNTSNGILTTGNWYHVAAVNNGGTRHLYLNGIEQSLSGTGTVSANSDPLCIGVDYKSSGRYFVGDIDEVRIWNDARTAQEIRENMHKTIESKEAGLVSYWQFNDGSGSNTLKDVAGNHDGTLNNMDVNSCWINSTIPAGGGTSNSSNSFTTGTASLGNVQLTTSDAFDNAVDLVNTEINRTPNTTSGTSGNVLNKDFVIKAYENPGSFSTNLSFTLPEGYISAADQSTPSNLKLYSRESNAEGDWSLVASASSATSTTVTFNGINSFSQFIISSASSPLPVELKSFTANAIGNSKIVLSWQTATEVNNYGFEIQRSVISDQLLEWEVIGFMNGHGNSNSPKDYSFTDQSAAVAERSRSYRLKQIDNDGKYSYSDEINVTVENIPTEFAMFQNYPNPFNPTTVISYQLPVAGNVTLKIYDVLGREVATLVNEVQQAGKYNVQLSADNYHLSSGVYIYRINAGKFSEEKKLLLLK